MGFELGSSLIIISCVKAYPKNEGIDYRLYTLQRCLVNFGDFLILFLDITFSHLLLSTN
jgi:hypothetical protein